MAALVLLEHSTRTPGKFNFLASERLPAPVTTTSRLHHYSTKQLVQ
uniref:Uncharacterized protein n=1 Tax=Arundo donax TaxID=35708 RepID=A0A0A9A2Y0_ARUDO